MRDMGSGLPGEPPVHVLFFRRLSGKRRRNCPAVPPLLRSCLETSAGEPRAHHGCYTFVSRRFASRDLGEGTRVGAQSSFSPWSDFTPLGLTKRDEIAAVK